MSRDARRLLIALAVAASWGLATSALSESLEGVTRFYAGTVELALRALGVACVREGTILYVPAQATTLTLADTGIFWWGVLGGLAVAADWSRGIKAAAAAGAVSGFFLLQVVYGLALAVTRHGLVLVTHVAWYATFLSLLAVIAVFILGPAADAPALPREAAPVPAAPTAGN